MASFVARRALLSGAATRLVALAVLLLAGSVALSGCFSMMPGRRASSGGGRTELVVINRTGVSIFYLYISPCESSSWGDDVLGSDVIASGNSWTFTLAPGCYDLKAVDRNEREAIERNVRISGSGKRWTLS